MSFSCVTLLGLHGWISRRLHASAEAWHHHDVRCAPKCYRASQGRIDTLVTAELNVWTDQFHPTSDPSTPGPCEARYHGWYGNWTCALESCHPGWGQPTVHLSTGEARGTEESFLPQ